MASKEAKAEAKHMAALSLRVSKALYYIRVLGSFCIHMGNFRMPVDYVTDRMIYTETREWSPKE